MYQLKRLRSINAKFMATIYFFLKELQHFYIIFSLEPLKRGWQPQIMIMIVNAHNLEDDLELPTKVKGLKKENDLEMLQFFWKRVYQNTFNFLLTLQVAYR